MIDPEPPPPGPNQYLTPDQVAEILGVGRQTVLDLCDPAAPKLRHYRPTPKTIRVLRGDLEAFIKASREQRPVIGPLARRLLPLLLEAGPLSLADLVAATDADAAEVTEVLEQLVRSGVLGVSGRAATRHRPSRKKARVR